jgi:undecaprenyl-diphosphatase
MQSDPSTDLFSLKSLLKLDASWSERLRMTPSRRFWFQVAAFLAHSGDSWFWLAGLFLIWLLVPGEWHTRAAVMAGGIVVLAPTVLLIKSTIRRQRPPGEWGAIYRNSDPHSFPSGHAARMAMLTVIAIGLGPAWFAGLLLIWAPLVSLARVLTGVHYLSDIIAGILLGLLAGLIGLAISPFIISLFPFIF